MQIVVVGTQASGGRVNHPIGVYGGLMSLDELRRGPTSPIAAVRGQYLLQGHHPAAGNAVAESFTSLRSAISRASELISSGYVIEFWSPTSFESQRQGSLPASRVEDGDGFDRHHQA